MEVHILSGGAAKGVVAGLEREFAAKTGAGISGSYGAVGAMKEKLLAGEPCDVVILTAALIEELTAAGHLVAGSGAPLGRVRTGVAVRSGDPVPDVSTPEALAAALCAARGIYFPDPHRATAGIHFANVLRKLGIYDSVAPYLRPYPNGATAMAQMAQSTDPQLIGCTQVTEIRYTEGVTLVDVLPAEFELATVYSAAVCTNAANREAAQVLVDMLSGSASAELRSKGGFDI